jgi:hypothetical protein
MTETMCETADWQTTTPRLRTSDRRDACLSALLSRDGDEDMPIQIRNISCTGIMAVVREPLKVGSYVFVTFRDGKRLQAKVRWSRLDQHGLQFVRGLSTRQLIGLFTSTPMPEPPIRHSLIRRLFGH